MLPSHLSESEAKGLQKNQVIAQFEIGAFRNFVYLVLDWDARRAAIVDPQKDLSEPLGALARHGFALELLLLTHTHHDHVAGVPELLQTHPELTLALHEGDLHRLPKGLVSSARERGRLRGLQDGERFEVGGLSLQALHTPGHSAGECSYHVLPRASDPGYLLTGDTLFIRDCGRTDLETGSTAEMFESLQKIRKLPPETVILPGHHYARECASTLERELLESPPLRCRSIQDLAALP